MVRCAMCCEVGNKVWDGAFSGHLLRAFRARGRTNQGGRCPPWTPLPLRGALFRKIWLAALPPLHARAIHQVPTPRETTAATHASMPLEKVALVGSGNWGSAIATKIGINVLANDMFDKGSAPPRP